MSAQALQLKVQDANEVQDVKSRRRFGRNGGTISIFAALHLSPSETHTRDTTLKRFESCLLVMCAIECKTRVTCCEGPQMLSEGC